MNISIDKSIFSNWKDDHDDPSNLHRFLTQATDRNHSISVSPNVTFEDVCVIQDSNDRQLLASALVAQNNLIVSSNPFNGEIIFGGESELVKKQFALHEIYEYIISPGILIVENGMNDGLFFRAIEKWFDPDVNFEQQLSLNRVMLDNMGGGDVCSRLDYYLSIHNGTPKFIRCIAVVDSDKRFETDMRKNKSHKESLKKFQENGQLFYALKKRALENYMPDSVFENVFIRHDSNWVNAYLSLSVKQKDYFCIASGFNKDITMPDGIEAENYDRFSYLPEEIKVLFQDISRGNFCHLLRGLNIPGAGSFKKKYPKYFCNPHTHKNSLLERTKDQTDPDELQHIAEMISKIL